MIARWTGKIKPGTASTHVTYFPDVMPTLAELGGASEYVPDNIDGISFLPALLGKQGQKKHDFLYWEDARYERVPPYGAEKGTMEQAVLMGKWKAVRNSPESEVELYNLSADIGEKKNVYDQNPDVVAELEKLSEEFRNDMGDTRCDRTGSDVRPIGEVADPKPLTLYDPDHPYIMAEYDLPHRG